MAYSLKNNPPPTSIGDNLRAHRGPRQSVGAPHLLRRLPRPGAGWVRGGRVLGCGGVLLNRMSLGRAWSRTELRELPKEEPLRLLHMLSSERVRYSERRGDRFP